MKPFYSGIIYLIALLLVARSGRALGLREMYPPVVVNAAAESKVVDRSEPKETKLEIVIHKLQSFFDLLENLWEKWWKKWGGLSAFFLIVGSVLVVALLPFIVALKSAKLTKVEGEIETLSQGELWMKQGVRFGLIRFLTSEGKLVSIYSVVIGNEIDRHLQPRVHGVFCYYGLRRIKILCGCKIGEELVLEDPTSRLRLIERLPGILLIVTGLVTWWLIITLPLIPWGIYHLAMFRKPSSQEVTQALQRT